MSKRLLGSFAVWMLVAAASCGKSPVCTPGESRTCACSDGRSGAQTCRADGSGLENCVCAPAPTPVAAAAPPAAPVAAASPAPAAPAAPAAAPSVLPSSAQAVPSPNSVDAAARLIGTWGIDVDRLGELEEIKKIPAERRQAAIEMAKGFAGSMSFEFSKEGMVMEAMGQRKVGTYKVVKSEGNKITLEATLDGKTETLQAEFQGNGLVLGKGTEKFALKRK